MKTQSGRGRGGRPTRLPPSGGGCPSFPSVVVHPPAFENGSPHLLLQWCSAPLPFRQGFVSPPLPRPPSLWRWLAHPFSFGGSSPLPPSFGPECTPTSPPSPSVRARQRKKEKKKTKEINKLEKQEKEKGRVKKVTKTTNKTENENGKTQRKIFKKLEKV